MKEAVPKWAKSTLQGLAYWSGYKKLFYPYYKLTEGAYVGELCQSIQSHKSDEDVLEAERMYKEIFPGLSGQIRVDLVLGTKDKEKIKKFREGKKKNKRIPIIDSENVHTIIEIKRYEQFKKIKEDLVRLANAKVKNNQVRCFLIVVCVDGRPKEFVNENDRAIGAVKGFKHNECSANVRMVKKTYESNRPGAKAIYALLIEVENLAP